MKLTQLEYFCTAVECQSITAAAKKLYVTQPAISGAIRELEKEFSVSLFSHARNKMTLTDEGRIFYERAEQLLREVESAKQQLSDLGSAQQNVKVGIPPLWGTTFFPDLLHDFNARHPNIRLTFYEYGSARAAALVKEKELDIALAIEKVGHPLIQSTPLFRDQIYIMVSQNLLNFSLTAAPPQRHLPATAGEAGVHSGGRSARPSCPDRRQRCGC